MGKSSEKKRPRDEETHSATSKKQKVKNLDTDKKKSKKSTKKETSSTPKVTKKKSNKDEDKKDKKDKKDKEEKKVSVKEESDASSSEDESDNSSKEDKSKTATKLAEPSTSDNSSSSSQDQSASESAKPVPTADTPIQSVESRLRSNRIFRPTFAPESPEYPLYTQTVSLRTALFPVGFDKPAAAASKQLLAPLLGRYSSIYHGILLNYKNVVVAERPSRHGASETNHTAVKVQSHDEFAVGFGWVTADCDLFVPAVGSWMCGEVVLQTEGHIGVVCWGKFNASIEAGRLPSGWRWVAAEEAELDLDADGMDLDTSMLGDESAAPQTGYWADDNGTLVDGKVLFRIKRFDVGVRDDHSFVSIEGSMLSDVDEKAVRDAELAREENRRSKASGYLMGRAKRIDDFAVTDCGVQEEEIRDIRSQIDWRRARPPTPTSYSMT